MPPKLPPDPYPKDPDVTVAGFEYIEALVVRRETVAPRPKVQWLVDTDYPVRLQVDGKKKRIVVPKGTRTDFSSVPWYFRWLVPRIGPHAEASVVHDYLYEAWACYRDTPRRQDQLFADRVFRAGMISASVRPWRRFLAYLAVRVFGWWVFKKHTQGGVRAGSIPYLDVGEQVDAD